ncbi:MAG: hypothetical protein GY952_09025 [Rhodobacteraceae bacterium]|nr:hypothetical protein [Paracoccaceae bacterium]
MTIKQEMTRYSSFLLRLWQEEKTKRSVTWHGKVESIQTGRKWQFSAPEALFDFLWTEVEGVQSETSSLAQKFTQE